MTAATKDNTLNGKTLYSGPFAAPKYLKSRSKLAKDGLKPGTDDPDAYVSWSDGSRAPYGVFDKNRAVPIPVAPNREQRYEDREAAVAWAASVLSAPNTLVVDTETTGLTGRVVELSAVAADGTRVLDTLVNPEGEPIEDGAREVHGITDEQVADAPTLADLSDKITALDGYTMIAWNGRFDQQALVRSFQGSGLGLPAWVSRSWHDAMLWHAQYVGEWDEGKGQYRWHRAGGSHRCAEDCDAVWEKVRQMNGNLPDSRTLQKARGVIEQQRAAGEYTSLTGDEAAAKIADMLFPR